MDEPYHWEEDVKLGNQARGQFAYLAAQLFGMMYSDTDYYLAGLGLGIGSYKVEGDVYLTNFDEPQSEQQRNLECYQAVDGYLKRLKGVAFSVGISHGDAGRDFCRQMGMVGGLDSDETGRRKVFRISGHHNGNYW
ncbi:MAG: hypothetical protein GY866_33610 [Proteobacteria bacterium]|nr:hypothetical protein [Pseudomonadota bacterium]